MDCANRARGERAKAHKTQAAPNHVPALCASPIEPVHEPASAIAARASSAWARLIRKVYAADPLECPKCHGPMRTLTLINDPPVVRRILEHVGLWQPEAMERSRAGRERSGIDLLNRFRQPPRGRSTGTVFCPLSAVSRVPTWLAR